MYGGHEKHVMVMNKNPDIYRECPEKNDSPSILPEH